MRMVIEGDMPIWFELHLGWACAVQLFVVIDK